MAAGKFVQILTAKSRFLGAKFAASQAGQPQIGKSVREMLEIVKKITDDLLGIHIIEFDMLPPALRVKDPALRDLKEVNEHILARAILFFGQIIKFVNHGIASAGKLDDFGIADSAIHMASGLIDLNHVIDFFHSVSRALLILMRKSFFLSVIVISFELHVIAHIPDVVTLVKFDVEEHCLFWMLVQDFAIFQVYGNKLQ